MDVKKQKKINKITLFKLNSTRLKDNKETQFQLLLIITILNKTFSCKASKKTCFDRTVFRVEFEKSFSFKLKLRQNVNPVMYNVIGATI